ncbi:hypothetical protein [Rhodococcus aetherivorans]|jgi:hypothetical protein|nr:hypothetical protein [Rhodococcus aetherivorans]CCW14023.1 hypothetical protein EBESD8_45880 [Rhodococcus aetherivorans]
MIDHTVVAKVDVRRLHATGVVIDGAMRLRFVGVVVGAVDVDAIGVQPR